MKTEIIRKNLIRKMLSRRAIGHNHFRLETLMKCGWKGHEKGLVRESVKYFLKKGIIVWANKSKKALTLNKERIKEIKLHYAKEG